ncbi:MAG: bifunctional DedA family/phosphatase PAP2 family protein [Pseudomonas marincola]|uniref:bifunctional DedA family/phosphatase PAP2 family protein n=1 Tax=Pseudomonas marincola TaxID=437900 RepID=UPI0030010108
MSQWLESITTWLAANPHWLGAAVFIVACTECLAIAGIIVPGTILLFAVAVMAGSGALSLGETLLLGFAGGLLGDVLSYTLGRYFHQDIRRLPGLRTHPQWLSAAENYFRRYGIASLLVGRFIGPLRPMLPMVAGMFNMPALRFFGVSLVAGAGWSIAYLMPGWATGAALRLPLQEGFWTQAAIVGASLALFLGASIQLAVRASSRSSMINAALSLLLLIALMIGWPHLSAFDNGLMTLTQEVRTTGFDSIAVFVTLLGNFVPQLVAGCALVVLLLVTKQWRAALFAGTTLLGTAASNGALKEWFARTRPEILLEPLQTFSFPSGHSSAAFAFFLTLGVLAGRGQPARSRLSWMLVAGLAALSIALSRIYLGVHWPSDILAGAMLATTWCALSLSIYRFIGPVPALPPRVWWPVLAACLGILGAYAVFNLSDSLLTYRYL